MKILLLGVKGQLGWELNSKLDSLGEVNAMDREELDLQNLKDLQSKIMKYEPELIVNAAAYTAVDKAESEPDVARIINAESVRIMAEAAQQLDSRLVHYSTDYVFDGVKTDDYIETDKTNPLNVYGKTKLQGELAIEQSGCDYLIFRTSWVIGKHGHNFVKTILHLAQEKNELKIVGDQIGAPTSTNLLADITLQAINSDIESGLYHLTPGGYTSWHGLAVHVVKRTMNNNFALRLTPAQIKAIPTSEYPTPAKRPLNSRLNTKKISEKLEMKMPNWQKGVNEIVDYLTMREKEA